MKLFLLVSILLGFLVLSSLYITKEDSSLDKEIKAIKHPNVKPLIEFHQKFSKIDVHSKKLDLDKLIKEVKQARKLYPLDDKLKTIDMELEDKRANETN